MVENSNKELLAQVANLKDHYILCGAGRTGIYIAEEFVRLEVPFVIIEQEPTVIESCQSQIGADLLYLEGDATEDETLELAGIGRAKGLITTLGDDKDNIFVVLTARSLNPNLRIVTRVNNGEENVEKLRKAGADEIVLPNVVGGMRMASEMIRPEVVIFLDRMLRTSEKKKRLRLTNLYADEIKISTLDPAKLCIADVGQHTNLLVVAIKRDGQYQYKPRGDTQLRRSTESHSGDVLVVVGSQEELDKATEGSL